VRHYEKQNKNKPRSLKLTGNDKWDLIRNLAPSFVCVLYKFNWAIISRFFFVRMPQHEDHAFYIELAADLQLTQLCEIEKTRKKSRQVQRKQPSQYYHRKHVRDIDFFSPSGVWPLLFCMADTNEGKKLGHFLSTGAFKKNISELTFHQSNL